VTLWRLKLRSLGCTCQIYVALMNWMPIKQVTYGKNYSKGHHKYMCYNEIGIRVQNIDIILTPRSNTTAMTLSKYFQGNKKLHFNFLLHFYISTSSTMGTEIDNLRDSRSRLRDTSVPSNSRHSTWS
jgi:competence CoiA-like predicted nuclease